MTDDDGYARIAAQFSLLQGEVISERAHADKAEAALHALEAQVHAEETPHRTRMRVAEARVKVLEAALREIEDGACYTPAYHSNCDGKCKSVARAALEIAS